MMAPSGHTLGLIAAAAAFAAIAAGCYYAPAYRYDDGYYNYYGYPRYAPYTSLHLGIFGTTHGHHYDRDRGHWRGVPYHHKGDHPRGKHEHFRGETHRRHDHGDRHSRGERRRR